MKGISSLRSSYSAPINESILSNGGSNSQEVKRIVDRILNSKPTSIPDIAVDDDPKTRRYAELVASLLNKRCGWSTYYPGAFVNIEGKKSILFLNDKSREAVGFAPTSRETNSTFYYFPEYRFDNMKQTGNVLVVDSGEMGIVQAFSIIIDRIQNPNLYRTPIKEAEDMSYDDASKAYNASIASTKFKQFDTFMTGADKGHQVSRMTPAGVHALAAEIKNNNLDPILVLREMRNGTENGMRYREILNLGGDMDANGRGAKVLSAESYTVALKYICKLINGNVSTMNAVTVAPLPSAGATSAPAPAPAPASAPTTQKPGDWTYNGIDVNFLKRMGVNWDDFMTEAKTYQSTLDSMERLLRNFIKYSRANNNEKLTNPDFRGMPTALFISGIGGIGKSNSWKAVKRDANLKVRRGFDYAEIGSGTVLPQEVYKFIYANNGKLLVFDDTPDLFNSSYAPAFWKAVLTMPEEEFANVQAPKTTNGAYYSLDDCKIGSIVSAKLRYEKECPPERVPYKAGMSAEEKAKLEAESKVRYIPNEIPVRSKFLFIVNDDEMALQKQLGEHWGAIKSRTRFYAIAPPAYVLWTKIKQNIVSTRSDRMRAWIPDEYADEVIAFVEDLIVKGEAQQLSFRGFGDGQIRYAITQGDDWENIIKQNIKVTTLKNR